MGPRSEKLVFNSILNFRRVTHVWLCLLETQVGYQSYMPETFSFKIELGRSLILKSTHFYRTQEGQVYRWLFNFRSTSVHQYAISKLISFILHG